MDASTGTGGHPIAPVRPPPHQEIGLFINRYAKVLGEQRDTLRTQVVARYGRNESIRDIAAGLGRSYGFVHTLLGEADVEMRSRGGKRRQRRSP
jgi:hypothetical protein